VGEQDQPQSARPADLAPTASPTLPSVLAVVVTHAPGPWLEEVLASLRDQDYPRLSVLVVDTANSDELAGRVRAALHDAKVVRRDADGFGAAANVALEDANRAALYLFCHDDVVLKLDAVSHLVDEVLRSNAAVVGPKLVDWDDPQRLQNVGLAVDKFGVAASLAEEGELDQEQHDAVTDVFAVPGACTMVRADLFRLIGGYDAAITFRGDDVDLCWRAQIAGARVMVVPDAVVRHRERLNERRGIDDVRRLRMRNQLRTMLSCYALPRLLVVLPQAILLAFAELLHALLLGRFAHAADVVHAWTWNARRANAIRRRRRAVRATRQVSDAELHHMLLRGSARLRAYLRGQIGRNDDRVAGLTNTGRQIATSLRTPVIRNTVVALALLVFALLVGSRHLITRPIPAIGELQPFHAGTADLLADWWRGWHVRAMGSSAPAPTAFGILGVLGIPLFGHAALLRTVLVLAPLPVGLFGAWRLLRPFGSQRASLVATVVYAATPVAYNAYAQGSWSALAMFAAAPWLLGALARASAARPFTLGPRTAASFRLRCLTLGLFVAVVCAAVPFALVALWLATLGLVVGSLVAGDNRGIARLAGTSAVASVVAFVLHLPWSLSFLRGNPTWASFGAAGDDEGARLGVSQLIRFHTGPFGGHLAGYGVLVVAAFALVLARGPRLGWAVRAWFVALVAWAVLWMGDQGWFPVALPNPGVLLAFAAAGLALAAGLGMLAFEVDLPRQRFGWRQLAPVGAVVALIITLLPLVAGASGGRWKMPRRDFTSTYAALGSDDAPGTGRVLWIGDPTVLPVAGFDLDGAGTGFATTDSTVPVFTDRWGGPDTTGMPLIRAAVSHAVNGDTSRLGRLLSPFGIRYVVAVEHQAPAPGTGVSVALDPALGRTLGGQLDLEQVTGVSDSITVYRNTSFVPIHAVLPPNLRTEVGADPLVAIARTDLGSSVPVLPDVDADGITAHGDVPAGAAVYVATTAAQQWHLSVDGHDAPRGDAFGWANVFAVADGGSATLHYDTPLRRRVLIIGQGVLWLVAIVVAGRLRDRERRR
jgi:GT2 family glycosyltransferase